MKVIITEKGSKMKTNNWIIGQEIDCHENIGHHFIELGIATHIDFKGKEEIKEPKTKKK